ncbi:HPP family protein [Marinomonas atlantica]|uniref:HPP family protein n=1 Tax=Marinomonas atlantica TaxID=1806668 RepID=UPI0008328900|nr:HPP family protein [Marinomonas atlantica]MCO4786924.1 HPP family protein [Marinomonas atlantica]
MLFNTVNQSSWGKALVAGLGACLCIFLLSVGGEISPEYLGLMAPFGATMVILFALPQSPLAQPRNIIGGHVLTAAIGVLMVHYFAVSPLSLGVAAGLGVAGMMLTNTLHPPAGANPLLIMLTQAPWSFVWNPVLTGCLVIVFVGWLYHRFVSGTQYPKKQG